MMCKGKIVLTARKLVSGGQEGSDWGCTVKGSTQRGAGPTSRDHRGQRARGRGWKRMRVERPGGHDGAERRVGWTPRATCGRGQPGAPACAPRPSRPRRPSAGPRTRLRLRPGRRRRARRGGRFLSGPAGEMDLARVAVLGVPQAARGSPLNPRGLGWRL